MRLGIIGSGNIAARHLNAIAGADPDVQVVAHLSRRRAGADAQAEQFGGRAFSQLGEFIGEGRPEAVIITVPPDQHGNLELELIAAGIPFLVEKPIGLDLATPVAISEAIDRSGLVVAVGYNWRALDTLPSVRQALTTTPLRMVLGEFHVGTPSAEWWRFAARSGGQMVEQACHLVDLARCLAGEGSLLGAAGSYGRLPGFADGDVAGTSAALFRFGSVPGVVTAACVLPRGPGAALRLICEDCEIVITLAGVSFIQGGAIQRLESQASSYWLQNRAFFAAVRAGDPEAVLCSYADALRTHELTLTAAQQSSVQS